MTLYTDYDLWQIRRMVENMPVDTADSHPIVREIALLKPEWRPQKAQSALSPQDVHRLSQIDPYGPPPMRNVITGALPSTPPQSYHLMKPNEVLQMPDVSAILSTDGVKIPDEAITVLYGPPGKGKSFISLHLAMKAAQSLPVIYIAAEKFYLYKPRLWAWMQHFQAQSEQIYFQRQSLDFANPAEVDAWMHHVAPIQPRLLVVDTVAASMKGDENMVMDTQKFVAGLRRVQARWPMAVLLVHHSGKDQSRGARGSSNWVGAADCMIALNANQNKIIRLHNVKQNGGDEFPDVHLRLKLIDLKFEDGRPATDPDDPTRPYRCPVLEPAARDDYADACQQQPSGTKQRILEVLDGYEQGVTAANIMDMTGIAKPTVYRTLNHLIDEGFATKSGETYSLSLSHPLGK